MDKERACEPQHLQGWTDIRLTSLIAPCFWRVHADIRRGGHAEYWLTGGRGSGKSSFVSIEILLGLMRDEQANALIYRKVADTLRDSVYAQMLWAIDRLGVAEEWQAKISPMELLYRPTGQRVLFRGADDPQKSKGIKLIQKPGRHPHDHGERNPRGEGDDTVYLQSAAQRERMGQRGGAGTQGGPHAASQRLSRHAAGMAG